MEEWIILISASQISYVSNIDSKKVIINNGFQYKSSIHEKKNEKRNINYNIVMQVEQVIRDDKNK